MSTIKKHNYQSATKWTYEGTTSNSRTNNKDWNAPTTAHQNIQITTNQGAINSNLNLQPHCLTKTSSKAVEMSQSICNY